VLVETRCSACTDGAAAQTSTAANIDKIALVIVGATPSKKGRKGKPAKVKTQRMGQTSNARSSDQFPILIREIIPSIAQASYLHISRQGRYSRQNAYFSRPGRWNLPVAATAKCQQKSEQTLRIFWH
jgi:hypothetical protein